MSDELGRLLLKALNGLPTEEQAELLGHLVDRSAPTTDWGAPLPGSMMVRPVTPGVMDEVFAAAQAVRPSRRAVPGERAERAERAEPELKVLPVRLPVSDYERLREWSKSHEFSMAVIVRTLVERFLDGQERAT